MISLYRLPMRCCRQVRGTQGSVVMTSCLSSSEDCVSALMPGKVAQPHWQVWSRAGGQETEKEVRLLDGNCDARAGDGGRKVTKGRRVFPYCCCRWEHTQHENSEFQFYLGTY